MAMAKAAIGAFRAYRVQWKLIIIIFIFPTPCEKKKSEYGVMYLDGKEGNTEDQIRKVNVHPTVSPERFWASPSGHSSD